MSAPVRVLIATTAGPVAIERIVPVPLQHSRAYVWASLDALAISNSYDEFVREWISRIPALDRGRRFRLDLSGEIHVGDSWQFAVFLAHALQSVGRLAARNDQGGAPALLVATGSVDSALAVGEVGFVEDKLRLLRADPAILEALSNGQRVIVALPAVNAAEAALEIERVTQLGAEIHPVSHVEDLLTKLDMVLRPHGPEQGSAWRGSPFRGLGVFDIRHRRIFCGRGKAREEVLQMLRRQDQAGCGFLLIHGSSGVGKSSLARAGLLAELQETAGPHDRWRTAVVLPSRGGVPPLGALAAALVEALPGLTSQALETRMRDGAAGAVQLIADTLQVLAADGRVRLALLVDQLEELLLWAREQPGPDAARERDIFAEILARLARTRLVWVIATLRSDLIALVEDSPVLSDLAKNERLYRLERPRAGALDEIIRTPATLAGLRFEGADEDGTPLVDVLTEAARRQQDCLPLLQFTLQLLYDDDSGAPDTITYAQYLRIGGLENAIGIWADKTVSPLDAADDTRRAVDDVIFNLARRERDTSVVVAADFVPPASFLSPVRQRVVTALEQARLIVSDADPRTQQRTIRVAHEALLTHWARARALFKTHGAKLALKEDVERGAARWREQGEEDGFLIVSSAPLAEAAALLEDGRVGLSDVARRHVEASLAWHRLAVESANARLARDEQKIVALIEASNFGEAAAELARVVTNLAAETDPALRARAGEMSARLERLDILARYDAAARTVFPLAGQEDFDQARQACETALAALRALEGGDWLNQLPTAELDPEQVADLLQSIYRVLLLYAGLQLVPAIRSLFAGGPVTRPRWTSIVDPKTLIRIVPPPLIAALLRRGGVGPAQLRARQDNAAARDALDRSLAALRGAARMEAEGAIGGRRRSQTSFLVERLVTILSELALGPKGQPIDFSKWLASTTPPQFAEPVNAVDYFFVSLFNYFIAKRQKHGDVAAYLSLLRGNFPELDSRAPLPTAERLLRVAVALEPRNFWTHWVLGRTLLEARSYGSAELAFNAAVGLEPHYARGYEQRALALAYQWRRNRDDRLKTRALADSAMAARTADGDPSIFWPRGELFDVFGDERAALDAYLHWLELEEDILATVSRRDGVAQLSRRAEALLAKSSAATHHADAHALSAMVHWTRRSDEAAIKAADAALRIVPGHLHALAAKGAALRRQGESARALEEALNHAATLTPANFWVLWNRASALERLASGAVALAAWEALLASAKSPTGAFCPAWIQASAQEAVARLRAPQPVG